MDICNGEGFYEELFSFKETAAVGEKWAFFGMGDANFINNSGSYFVLQLGIMLYMLFFYLVNKACVLNAKSVVARKVGMFVHEDDYWDSFVDGSVKLFLESYFDLVICTAINISSFFRSKNLQDFKEFFGTSEDILCSTISITYMMFVVFFPYYSFKYIKHHENRLEKMEGFLNILLEGVNIEKYHGYMFIVYFLIRRLLTGIGLVIFAEWPFL
jgi:hypothetical protein